MRSGILEIVGMFLVIAGACFLVAASARVSTTLALAVAGGFIMLAGALTAYVAAVLGEQGKARPARGEPR